MLRKCLIGFFLWLGTFITGKANERPNIIIIMADDMGYSDLGFMGSEIETPNIDHLANNGLMMTNFYNTARSAPTRASLLTGLYQHQTGVGHMTSDMGYPSYQGHLNDQCVTIAEALDQGGYQSFMAGKWHVGTEQGSHPLERGFDKLYGVPKGGGIYFHPFLIDRDVYHNEKKIEQFPDDYYSTEAFNRYATRFISDHAGSDDPFFLYLAHIAPHFPLQAPEDVIDKYKDQYRHNFQKFRKQRYQRMKERGILPDKALLSPPDESVNDWDQLTSAEKDTAALKMATYAAQIDVMDKGIGKIIDKLKKIGEYQNTVIFFLSDNGACSADIDPENRGITVEGPIGSQKCWESYGPSWANVSNTPYRLYKKYTHEGGVITPLIIHYPKAIKNHRIDHQVGHVIDLMPTCLDLADTPYPSEYRGNKILPYEGKSLLPIIKGKKRDPHKLLGWEHTGNKAVRMNDWKLVKKFSAEDWALYNLSEDPTELNDMSSKHPQQVQKMKSEYKGWAERVGVIPWEKLTGNQ